MSRIVLLLLLLCVNATLFSQINSTNKTAPHYVKDFMDKRFGMFIHWGPISLRGTEIGWSRNNQVDQNDYDSLYKEFNPVLFNADAWVKSAHDAGMKYLTITAKHHDGFCLWPTKFTDYNIFKTPFKKDIVGALAKSCKKYGIKFCIYYTVLDWYDLRYPIHNDGSKKQDPKGNMNDFIIFMKNQLRELIINYDPYMLWFDGNWEEPWTYEMGVEIYDYIKTLSPKVVINNRLGKGNHKIMDNQSIGDYATPEQEVGKINMEVPWESCITMCKQWAWKPNDELKSLKKCIQTLASTAGGNGNLLFNIGPMLDGRIESRQVNRLKEIGIWMKTNGEAIYETKGGPYAPDSLLATTRKGNLVNLLVFNKVGDTLSLPYIPGCLVKNVYIKGGAKLLFIQKENRILINLPLKLPNENCTVIVMEMDKNIEKVPLITYSTK